MMGPTPSLKIHIFNIKIHIIFEQVMLLASVGF
jgi:hypothetical protein